MLTFESVSEDVFHDDKELLEGDVFIVQHATV